MDLKKYLRQEFRFQRGGLTLREPNAEEREKLKEILSANIQRDENGKISGKFDARYIYRNFTSFGEDIDSLSDEEFEELINDEGQKYNRDIQLLNESVVELVQEISEDVIKDSMAQVKQVNSLLNILNDTSDIEKTYAKLSKFLKKGGYDISVEELIKTGGDIKKIAELQEKSKTTKKKKK